MKKSELIKIIELVVRKEVKKQVKQILITEKSIKPKPVIQSKPKPKPKVQQHFTDNAELNKVLNETVGLNDKSQEDEEWPTMGGSAFDSTKMAEALGYGNIGPGGNQELQRQMGAVQTMKDAGVTTEQVPEGVVDALTKDYSALMKHINSKKGK